MTVRPFNTFGPRQSMRAVIPTIITQALWSDRIRLGSLAPTRDFTFVKDTADGFLAAAGPMAWRARSSTSGTAARSRSATSSRWSRTSTGSDLPVESEDARKRPAKSEVERLVADASKARDRLGWDPRHSLADGIRATTDWIAARGPGAHSRGLRRMSFEAVVLAGGKGTRLSPFTYVLPKPLLPLGQRPILDIVLTQLARAGCTKVTLAIGHLGHYIEIYCGDGSRWGLDVDYFREDEPLGTVGAVAQIPRPEAAFVMMNGDVLSDVSIAGLVDAHRESGAELTIGSFRRTERDELGVIDSDGDGRVTGYREKPEHHYLVSMGIYVVSPSVIDVIPAGRPDGLPRPRPGADRPGAHGALARPLRVLARPRPRGRLHARERAGRRDIRAARHRPMTAWRIPLSDVDLGAEEREAVVAVVESGWLTIGAEVRAFEQEFASFCGADEAVCVSSGTAALHLACLALGLGPGDEVILPSLTFVACANAVALTGRAPGVRGRLQPDDLTIDPADVERRVTDRTRAVMCVHYGGFAAAWPRSSSSARSTALALIEDVAHAPAPPGRARARHDR